MLPLRKKFMFFFIYNLALIPHLAIIFEETLTLEYLFILFSKRHLIKKNSKLFNVYQNHIMEIE